MKLSIQYLHDSNGTTQAIQLPVSDWQLVVAKLRKYEQTLRLKTDLTDAFKHVKKMQQGKSKKQELTDFLNEL